MEPSAPIPLRRARGVGDVLNVTFAFIRQNVVLLAKSLLFIAGPLYALSALLNVVLQSYILRTDPASGTLFQGEAFALVYVLNLVVGVAATALFLTVTLGFMRLYELHGPDGFAVRDVWELARQRFWRMLGTLLVLGILFGGSVLLIIIPCLGALAFLIGGAYFAVAFAPAFPLRMWEDVDLFIALRRSRELVKDYWWPTGGVVLISGITYFIMAFIFNLPLFAFSMLSTFHNLQEESLQTATVVVLAVASFIGSLGAALLYAVPILALGFQYLSLVERKEHTGLQNRVAAMLEQTKGPPEEDAPNASFSG